MSAPAMCIKCHKRAPMAGKALCGPCRVMVTGVLPPFPPLATLLAERDPK